MKIGKCYVCETGTLAKKKVNYKVLGVLIGNFGAEVCTKCGETFFDEDISREITKRTKEMGLGIKNENWRRWFYLGHKAEQKTY